MEWHKNDGAGQWAVFLDMPTRPLGTPHVVPHVLHQMYPHVLCWAADRVATPQKKFPLASPANVKVHEIPTHQAPRVLEASTLLIGEGTGSGDGSCIAPMDTGFYIGIAPGFGVRRSYVHVFST